MLVYFGQAETCKCIFGWNKLKLFKCILGVKWKLSYGRNIGTFTWSGILNSLLQFVHNFYNLDLYSNNLSFLSRSWILLLRYIDYLFLGDYVDRGQHSLETISLLLALKASFVLNKPDSIIVTLVLVDSSLFFYSFVMIYIQIEYPENIHLIRGNHEAADINALFGFRMECIERMVGKEFACLSAYNVRNTDFKIYVGGKWWNMGMDTIQSTFQFPSTRCSHRKENYLHAWWHWEVHHFSWTNWETGKANNNGCWIYHSNGPSMVHFFPNFSPYYQSCYLFEYFYHLYLNLQVRSHGEWQHRGIKTKCKRTWSSCFWGTMIHKLYLEVYYVFSFFLIFSLCFHFIVFSDPNFELSHFLW